MSDNHHKTEGFERIVSEDRSSPEADGRGETKTLVCLCAVLRGGERDDKIFDKLEDFYLSNYARGVTFSLMGTLLSGERRTTERDAAIKTYAEKRIRLLSGKYGDHFALFIRKRRRFGSRYAYQRNDGKQGWVREICRFLRGGDDDFLLTVCERNTLSGVKFLVLMNDDIGLYPDTIHKLVENMLRLENTPVSDHEKNVVASGCGFIRPCVIADFVCHTLFSEMAEAEPMLAGRSMENGILDVDAFLRVIDAFPEASDDAFYAFLNGKVISDIVITREIPQNAISYYYRKESEIRDGLQMARYLFRYVKNKDGKRIENPLSRASKYKILNELFCLSMPFLALMVLLIGALSGGVAMTVGVIFLFVSLFFRDVPRIFLIVRGVDLRALRRGALVFLFRVSAAAFEAVLFAKLSVRTCYRFLIGSSYAATSVATYHESEEKGCFDDYVLRFSPSMMIGLLFFCIPNTAGRILGVFWLGMPIIFWYLSRVRTPSFFLCEGDKRALYRYTRDAWSFFRDHVNDDTHGLPPNSVMLSPSVYISPKTSPRDIGLYYLSLLAARDFGYIDSGELYRKSDLTTQTVQSLFKWNGHLYQGYHTDSLKVWGDALISTEESGDFITSLIAFCEGAKEYAGEEPGLLDVIVSLDKVIEETDFSVLYDKESGRFYAGYQVSLGRYTDERHDFIFNRACLASYYAVARRFASSDCFCKISEGSIDNMGRCALASHKGSVTEFFMSSLFLPMQKHSFFGESLFRVFRAQKRRSIKRTVLGRKRRLFGISDSAYFAFDGEMHYQNGAFGLASLAKGDAAREEDVIAPYASFFMLGVAPEPVMENLRQLESIGMYGKYGFYEAMDFEASRVGRGYAYIRSFVSHHVGVSMISAANLLMEGVFRKRFLKNPSMRAYRELLSKKMKIRSFPHTQKRPVAKKTEPPKIVLEKTEKEKKYEYTLLHPNVALLTNHNMRIRASSGGHIAIECGEKMICSSDFDLYDLGKGLRVYVDIDGEVFPTVPLMGDTEGFASAFSFVAEADKLVYRSTHTDHKRTYAITLTLWVSPDKLLCGMVCDVNGDFEKASAFLYFEPFVTAGEWVWKSEYEEEERVLLFKRERGCVSCPLDILGVNAVPSMETGFFSTARETLLRRCPSECDYRELAKKQSFPDAVGESSFPVLAMKSAEVGARRGRITFALGVSDDADDLLYWLSRTKEERGRLSRLKMGELLNLQYGAAGLSRSVLPLEQFVLRSMAFGQIRPRVEHFRRIEKRSFEKFLITGENPMVLAVKFSDDAEGVSRLRELISLFKYMCIRGIRYDFVIFYRERVAPEKNVREVIMREVCRAGCEGFLSWACGIFPINEDMLTPGERFAYEVFAVTVFDLSCSPFSLALENARAIPLSAETESLLTAETITCPMTYEKMLVKDGEALSGSEPPAFEKDPYGMAWRFQLLSSRNLGMILTENSLGFTFFRDMTMGKLTPHANTMEEARGERLILRIYGSFDEKRYRDYDLCAVSSRVEYTDSSVRYCGEVDDARFGIEVTLSEAYDVKKSEVTLESGKSLRVALFYLVSPSLGERKAPSRFYRFHKEKDGIRIVRFTDGDIRNAALAVFSPDATALYTDMAAFRSDGMVFRGESDVAVICSRMELCGIRVIRCYLSVDFSEVMVDWQERLADF